MENKKYLDTISQIKIEEGNDYMNIKEELKKGEANKKEKVILIKDVLSDEINEVGMYVYILMQDSTSRANAIKAWDNLENMVNKPASDKEALTKIINILIRIGNKRPDLINPNSKKLMKLLEK